MNTEIERNRDARVTRCAQCGAALECGALAGARVCWCMAAPPLPAARLDAARGCLCPPCLARLANEKGAQPE